MTTRRDRPQVDEAQTVTMSGQHFSVLGQLDPGTRIGRYVVESTIGSGGMGVVYRANDPELGRDIALKLLRAERRPGSAGTRARARLLREAQALAQLSHPNVVAAYDVGTYGEGVFIAMELVDGVTLKKWLRAQSRSTGEILRVFLAAGQGVAAAHSAGLIHRDIKPDNILVGTDGRVVIVDFGLARPTLCTDLQSPAPSVHRDTVHRDVLDFDSGMSAPQSTADHDGAPTPVCATLSPAQLSASLTCAGAVLGTPGYMAPEQYLGQELDHRSDQFSYCVTLYEALYGRKPFTGPTADDVRARVLDGRMGSPPRGVKVPRRLEKILARGLSRESGDRFPAMTPLLAALGADPAKSWKRAGIALALLAILGGSIAIGTRTRDSASLCAASPSRASEPWNRDEAADLERHFRALGVAHASDTSRLVNELLSHRALAHEKMQRRICAATRIAGTQSEHLMDLRMRCLARRNHETAVLVRLLRKTTEPSVVDRAVSSTIALVSIDRCADITSLTATPPLPDAPELRRQITSVQNLLDEASVQQQAGLYDAALAIAETAVTQSETIGYAPLHAEALLRRGLLEGYLAAPKQSFATLGEAANTAAAARDDRILAEAALAQFANLANKQLRLDAALAFAPLVQATVERAGNDAASRADVATTLGFVYSRMSRPRAARSNLERAVAILTETYGSANLRVVHPLNQLAYVLAAAGEHEGALRMLNRSVDIITSELGPSHPRLIPFVSNIGAMLIEQEKFAEARPHVQRALSLARATLGAKHQKVAIGLTNLARIDREQGDCPSALTSYALAMEIFEGALGAESRYLSYPLLGAAKCHLVMGRADLARGPLERALTIHVRAGGDPAELADISFTLANALWRPGAGRSDRDRARTMAIQAQTSLRRAPDAKLERIREVEAWLTARAGRDGIH